MQETIKFQQEIITMLSAELKEALSHSQRLEKDDQQTHYYTGLISYAVFNNLSEILGHVLSRNPNTSKGKLSIKDQLLLVLMKLRTGASNKDLAYRFGISPGRVSQLFHEWIDILSRELKQLIVWPDREMLRKTLPQCFKPAYARATCIIDCSEVISREQHPYLPEVKHFPTIKATILQNFLLQ